MAIAMTALIVILPVLGVIPAHMEKAADATPVHYERYDYR